eukprot:m.464405 g.464405  ORF g.464405 m.464405 type:complete len:647 (+) comp23490_c0_seq1:347-2287(+)
MDGWSIPRNTDPQARVWTPMEGVLDKSLDSQGHVRSGDARDGTSTKKGVTRFREPTPPASPPHLPGEMFEAGETSPLISRSPSSSSKGGISRSNSIFSPLADPTTTRSGGCFGVQRGARRLFARYGLGQVWKCVRIAFGILGYMLVWVGGWNLGQYDCAFSPQDPICVQNPSNVSGNGTVLWYNYGRPGRPGVNPSVHRDIFDIGLPRWLGGSNLVAFRGELTMIVGFLLMIASDTVYSGLSLEGAYFPWLHRNELKSTEPGRVLIVIRLIGGLAGTVLFWGGMYSMMVYLPPLSTWTFCHPTLDSCPRDALVHIIVFSVGILILFATGTWSGATFLWNDADDGEPNPLQRFCRMHDVADSTAMTRRDHVRYTIRCTVSVAGQTLIWIAATRAMAATTVLADDAYWQAMSYAWAGLALMAMTDSVEANSAIVEADGADASAVLDEIANLIDRETAIGGELDNTYQDVDRSQAEEEAKERRQATVKFYFVSSVSYLGQILFVNAVWVLIDTYWVQTAVTINDPGDWLYYKSTELNLYMIAVGMVMLSIAGALMTNGGLAVVQFYTTPSMSELSSELSKLEKTLVREERSNTMRSLQSLRDIVMRPSPATRRRRANTGPETQLSDWDQRGRSSLHSLNSDSPLASSLR